MALLYRDLDQPLLQFEVVSGKIRVGQIWKERSPEVARGTELWWWQITLQLVGQTHRGHAQSFAKAKAAFERTWYAWLLEAELHE
jgi:hypothetical protein